MEFRPPSLNREDAFVIPCHCQSCQSDVATVLADARVAVQFYAGLVARIARGLAQVVVDMQDAPPEGASST